MKKWIVCGCCLCWILMTRGQSKEYFIQAAKSYQDVAAKTKCEARRTWALAWVKYCNCWVNVYTNSVTPNCPQPSNVPPPCPADAGQGSGLGSDQGSGLGSGDIGGSSSSPGESGNADNSTAINQYLNPYLQQLYQQFTGSAPDMTNLAAISSNYNWIDYAGVSRGTLTGLTTAATNLYSTLGQYDQETVARLSITSGVGSILSIAGGLNNKDAATVQAFSQGIGLLWDAFAKSSAKRKAEQARLESEAAEQQRLAVEKEHTAALERAKKEYEEKLLTAKGEFLYALEKKTFSISYAGEERKAIFVWFPQKISVTVQHFYISNMIIIKPYSDGSFPLKDELYRLYSKSLPAMLRNSDTLRYAVIYPIGNDQDFQLKFLSLLKATENLALMPMMANIQAPIHEETSGDLDFWGNPIKANGAKGSSSAKGSPNEKAPSNTKTAPNAKATAKPDTIPHSKTTPNSKATPPKKDDFWNN